MASPAKVTEVLPDTLPEDFGEWDGEGSPSTHPAQPANPEPSHGIGVVSRPALEPTEKHSTAAPSGNLLRGAALPATATEYVDDAAFLHRVRSLSPNLDRTREVVVQRQAAAPAIDEVRFSAPRPNSTAQAAAAVVRKATPAPQAAVAQAAAPQVAAMSEADEILFHSFRANAIEATEPKQTKKKWLLIAGASAALAVVLAAVMIPLLHHQTASPARPAPPSEPSVTVIEQPEDAAPKPSPSTVTTPAKPSPAASDNDDSSDAEPQPSDQDQATPSEAQAQMMNDQLSEPARIHMTATPQEQAPPPSGSFAVAEMDGIGNNNAIGSVFGSGKQLKVQAALPKVVNVSAGVAIGLLVQKTPPVYPQIAKAARVSGTVVLHAMISKTGAIEDLKVLSGPMMLRQAAVDAVRTWRYKPYKLNNQPTEIETTINVIFSLAG
jgi:periplasmic protein TonB